MSTPDKYAARRRFMAISLARLRAWAELGVPVRGEWSSRWIAESSQPNSVSAELRPALEISCSVCDAQGFAAYEASMEANTSLEPNAIALAIEKVAFGRLGQTTCTHCDRLKDPEPPDLEATASLLAVESPDLIG